MAPAPPRRQALIAACTAAAFLTSPVALAAPGPVSPQDAQAWRTPIQERTKAQIESGDALGAATQLDAAAKQHGDPVLFLDAAEAYFAAAKQQQDAGPIDLGLERVAVALDILYFLRDPMADSEWRVVAPTEVGALINRANEDLRQARTLREEIEAGPTDGEEDNQKKRRKRGPAKPMLIAGAATTALGVAGLGVGAVGLGLGAKHQNTAEDPTTYGPIYDDVEKKGKRANVIAIVGLVTGGVLVGAGVALIILAKKREKKSSSAPEEETASLRIAPTLGGVNLSGRF